MTKSNLEYQAHTAVGIFVLIPVAAFIFARMALSWTLARLVCIARGHDYIIGCKNSVTCELCGKVSRVRIKLPDALSSPRGL